jgi:hypothetical protein
MSNCIESDHQRVDLGRTGRLLGNQNGIVLWLDTGTAHRSRHQGRPLGAHFVVKICSAAWMLGSMPSTRLRWAATSGSILAEREACWSPAALPLIA